MADGYLLDAKDEVLQKASIEAKESGSILPLLKVEIQCKIKQKLLEKGEDEITFMMSSPPRKRRTELTPEELEKKKIRQDQNKKAAKKFRQKEKAKKNSLDREIKEQREKNEKLRSQVQRLELEIANIWKCISNIKNET